MGPATGTASGALVRAGHDRGAPRVSITRHTYGHAIPALQKEAAEKITGLVLAEG
jgi:hypothetical protein